MNWKQTLLLGIAASLLAAMASIIYLNIYKEAFVVEYGAIIGMSNIVASCTIGCLLMAMTYKVVIKWKGTKALGWMNIVFSLISFASIVGVFGFNLPLDTESPELFPGMVIPMHFFPVLSFLTLFPFLQLNTDDKN